VIWISVSAGLPQGQESLPAAMRRTAGNHVFRQDAVFIIMVKEDHPSELRVELRGKQNRRKKR